MSDLEAFHLLQSNRNVMKYVTGNPLNYEENKNDLKRIIALYTDQMNDFWIYAVLQKSNNEFVGTCALVKDNDGIDEIGYRLIEEFWGKGFGFEICRGLLSYCKLKGIEFVVAYVANENIASSRILEKCNFIKIREALEPKLQLLETKYHLDL